MRVVRNKPESTPKYVSPTQLTLEGFETRFVQQQDHSNSLGESFLQNITM